MTSSTSATPWPDQIIGERVSLKLVQEAAVHTDWLEEAAQAVAGREAPCRLQARLDDGDRAWWIRADTSEGDVTVGVLSGRMVESESGLALVWTWLAIDARWRAYGFGGAAVPLYEQVGRELGAETALAPLPPDNGVALYFWLRLGYSPQRTVRLPEGARPAGVKDDALWMVRQLAEDRPVYG